MHEISSPYILFVGKDFIGAANKSFGFGFLGGFCLVEMLKKLGVDARKLNQEEAQNRLDEMGKIKGAIISKRDAYKNLVKQFFIGGLLWLTEKKIWYSGAFDLGEGLIIEFMIIIPRPFSTSNLVCYLWINAPYSETGATKLGEIYKTLKSKVGKPPVTEKEWEALEPIRSRLVEIGIEGTDVDLWPTIVA